MPELMFDILDFTSLTSSGEEGDKNILKKLRIPILSKSEPLSTGKKKQIN